MGTEWERSGNRMGTEWKQCAIIPFLKSKKQLLGQTELKSFLCDIAGARCFDAEIAR